MSNDSFFCEKSREDLDIDGDLERSGIDSKIETIDLNWESSKD
jgi:hypothetical protein